MRDVVVIGSGYGGSVVAARLAGRGSVLLVERGRRWRSGEFPKGLWGLARAYRTELGNPLGLWSMRLGQGTGNAFASGLGGASLVNYGIMSRPEDNAFDDWPVSAAALAPYFERALSVLRPEPAPFGDELGDKQFLDAIEPGRRVDIANTIDWSRCTSCGHCVPGCNEDAKRSLDQTYIALAERGGVEVLTGTELLDVVPLEDGGYELVLCKSDRPEERTRVRTRRLVMAAGTFGTLDILHRLEGVLPVSPMFGRRMSMNGDGLAFLYNTRHRLSGHHGAPITTSVRLPFQDPEGRTRTLMVMSGRIPKSVMRFAAAVMAVLGNGLGRRRRPADGDSVDPAGERVRRRLRDLVGAGEGGALSQTYMYKLDGQDAGRGEIRFDRDGRAAIDWPDYTEDPVMKFAAERLGEWATRVGGILIRDLGTWPGMRSFSVHPLGGCRMGSSVEQGVVDHLGRVYRPAGGLYAGLRIVDASILPGSLGVPPSLTLTAVAERIAEDLVAELDRARA